MSSCSLPTPSSSNMARCTPPMQASSQRISGVVGTCTDDPQSPILACVSFARSWTASLEIFALSKRLISYRPASQPAAVMAMGARTLVPISHSLLSSPTSRPPCVVAEGLFLGPPPFLSLPSRGRGAGREREARRARRKSMLLLPIHIVPPHHQRQQRQQQRGQPIGQRRGRPVAVYAVRRGPWRIR
jgi:hypothetical protein